LAPAEFSLGYCYEKGIGCSPDQKLANTYYARAEKQGYFLAKDALESQFGKSPENEKRALRDLKKPAKK